MDSRPIKRKKCPRRASNPDGPSEVHQLPKLARLPISARAQKGPAHRRLKPHLSRGRCPGSMETGHAALGDCELVEVRNLA